MLLKLHNQNKNDDYNNGILFNTSLYIESKMINYKGAYILLKN